MTSFTLASEYATDTVGLILRIERRKLGATARSIFEAAESGSVTIHIPTLVFAEILYLAEKQRIGLSLSSVIDYLQQFPNYKQYPMSLAVIQSAADITNIPELHDRLTAGTARSLHLALITNDPAIQASLHVRTVW